MQEKDKGPHIHWEHFDIKGIGLRPIEIRTTLNPNVVFYGVIQIGNIVFIPVNTRTDFEILEKMKTRNKNFATPDDMGNYAPSIIRTLGVNNGLKKGDCYTAIESRFHSNVIEFKLDNCEKLSPDGVFEKLHQIYPQLTFSRGKLPNQSL